MNLKNLKKEFFYLRKAFGVYRKGWSYVAQRWIEAPKARKRLTVSAATPQSPNLSIHVLSGKRDFTMLLWAIGSLRKHAGLTGKLYIHSDGSLTASHAATLRRIFPGVEVIQPQQFLEHYLNALSAYPTIQAFRREYDSRVTLKKLIDPYCVSTTAWHLVIDSDVLWFRPATEILEALAAPALERWSLMMEGEPGPNPNYIYFQDGTRLATDLANYNAGIVLFSHASLDLPRLASYLQRVDMRHPSSYFIDQAGYAFCLPNLRPLPRDRYAIEQKVNSLTVARHYTSPRRPLFYIEGVRQLANSLLK